MINQEIQEKYESVQSILENSLDQARQVEVVGEEENAELKAVISTLDSLNNSFKEEIENLESSSEWDKFCIAFFGETNAGKSTIIESLRIIYDEESRRMEMLKQAEDYQLALSKHCHEYQDLYDSIHKLNLELAEINDRRELEERQRAENEKAAIEKQEKENKHIKTVSAIKQVGFTVAGVIAGFALAQLGLF